MFKNNRSELVLMFTIALLIFSTIVAISFSAQNKQHIETIKIYEEYYTLDEDMDFAYREWVEYFPHYTEKEFYFTYYEEKYLRYLELKKKIGELKK